MFIDVAKRLLTKTTNGLKKVAQMVSWEILVDRGNR